MRLSTLLLFCLLLGHTYGQTFSYPQLPERAYEDSLFVPKHWKILKSVEGDLNRDGKDDIAFVIQYKDSVKLVKSDDDNNDTVTTQPRILAIAFYDATKHDYKLVIQNSTFILNHDNPYRDDPFDDLSITNGVLSIDFHLWFSWGTYEMSKTSYKFRYQNYIFELIGADSYSLHRATGETETRSYNFMTSRVKTTVGNMSVDTKTITWRKLPMTELKNIWTIKAPFNYEVEKGFFL